MFISKKKQRILWIIITVIVTFSMVATLSTLGF